MSNWLNSRTERGSETPTFMITLTLSLSHTRKHTHTHVHALTNWHSAIPAHTHLFSCLISYPISLLLESLTAWRDLNARTSVRGPWIMDHRVTFVDDKQENISLWESHANQVLLHTHFIKAYFRIYPSFMALMPLAAQQRPLKLFYECSNT